MPCEKTTKDGKVRCQGTVAHRGPCFFGGVTLADFDSAEAARMAESDGVRAIAALRGLVEAWSAAPIYVTGEGQMRFLDAVHECECVIDSLPKMTPEKSKT